jgi:hypothetical protein
MWVFSDGNVMGKIKWPAWYVKGGESRREMREFEMEEERREKLTDPVLMEQVFCFPED